MDPVYDSSLDEHLKRIEAYMRGCALLGVPRTRSRLRTALAGFLAAHLDRAIDEWVRLVGPALGIPEADWSDLHRAMHDAMVRWVRRGVYCTRTGSSSTAARTTRAGKVAWRATGAKTTASGVALASASAG